MLGTSRYRQHYANDVDRSKAWQFEFLTVGVIWNSDALSTTLESFEAWSTEQPGTTFLLSRSESSGLTESFVEFRHIPPNLHPG